MRAEKQLLLDEIKEKMEGSKGFVALAYQNFTSSRAREFRDRMAGVGGEFEVLKKRILVKAAESVAIVLDEKSLAGHVGVVFVADDVSRVAKEMVKFGEENESAVALLGGYMDGVVCSAAEMVEIAKLPGLLELRAQLLGVLAAPSAQTLRLLQALLAAPLYCLEERSKKVAS